MLTSKQTTHLSKLLSKALRHRPETLNLTLDAQGWVSVELLLTQLASNGYPIDREVLDHVVANNNKNRFAYSEDGQRIRASQGHSIAIDLGYTPVEPPEILFHGTATRNLDAIMSMGLTKQRRHHVHLSADRNTARMVGARHGKPVILCVAAGDMHGAGHLFYQSENGVWLTEAVPPSFLRLDAGEPELPN